MFEGSSLAPNTVTATTSETIVAEHFIRGSSGRINLEIQNAGPGATNAFKISLQDHDGGEFYEFLSGTDFDATNLSSLQFCTATGPHELPSGQRAHIIIDCGAAVRIRLSATSASTSAITTRGTATEER